MWSRFLKTDNRAFVIKGNCTSFCLKWKQDSKDKNLANFVQANRYRLFLSGPEAQQEMKCSIYTLPKMNFISAVNAHVKENMVNFFMHYLDFLTTVVKTNLTKKRWVFSFTASFSVIHRLEGICTTELDINKIKWKKKMKTKTMLTSALKVLT